MSSFHKVIESRPSVNGTRLKNNKLSISSGIPSLDHVIGGSLPVGSIFAVEEDVLGTYSRVLIKYFLAEGVVCQHDLFVASVDEEPRNIVQELPQECVAPPNDDTAPITGDVDKMKIAWRYESLGQVESSFGSNTNFGHHFDLSKHINMETIKNVNINYWCPSLQQQTVQGFRNVLYFELLSRIKQLVGMHQYQNSSKNKNILRIGIYSIGSPLWMAMDCEEPDCSSNTFGQDLIKFMYCLRVLLWNTNVVAFVTIPSHLFDDDTVRQRLLYSTDNAVRIESFAGSSKETNPMYKDYHGLFHITKLSAVNTLVNFVPPSLDLAFKLRRKKFVIEKLHLPPELQDSSEREQDDITATPKTCGGFKKKDIDF